MNGFEAARALKLSMPGVPLLMFTNTVGQFVRQEALAVGIASVCLILVTCWSKTQRHGSAFWDNLPTAPNHSVTDRWKFFKMQSL
jgi:hypothetical protein